MAKDIGKDAALWQRVETILMAVSRSMRRASDQRLAPLGLNLTEATVLAILEEQGSITQTQLAEKLRIGRASLGAVIDRLVSQRLVRRDPDSVDRRVWKVANTQKGHGLAEEVALVDARLRRDLRAGVSRSDRQQLTRTLLQFEANLAAVLAESVP
jgi:MarR family transcriptional regulator, organic hydroperoxide resistance regulator